MAAEGRPPVLFLWLLLLVAAGLAFSQSAYFAVRTAEVHGLSLLTTADVLAVAGVKFPVNVFALNPRLIRERLSDYPAVAGAVVERRLPAGLRITVRERQAVGALPYGEHLLLFDASGVPFAIRKPEEAPGLPQVTGTRIAAVRLGRPARGEELKWVATVLRSLPNPLKSEVVRVEVTPDGGLDFILSDGSRARLGTRAQFSLKLGLLQSVLAEAEAKGWRVREIDVRNPEQPFLSKGEPNTGEEGKR